MTTEDQRVVAHVIDILHDADPLRDAGHAAIVRQHLRQALGLISAFAIADDKARRRGRELQRRDEAAARIYTTNVRGGTR